MIHKENKNQQLEKEDFSIENFLTNEKKQPLTEQQEVTHREDFAKPEVDEEALMNIIAGEEPEELLQCFERNISILGRSKRTFDNYSRHVAALALTAKWCYVSSFGHHAGSKSKSCIKSGVRSLKDTSE